MATAFLTCGKCKRQHAARHLTHYGGICATCAIPQRMSYDEMRQVTQRGLLDTALRLAIIQGMMLRGAVTGPADLCCG